MTIADDRIVETRSFADVSERLSAIEQTMLGLDINERVNILAYAIAGYVVAMSPPGEREQTAKMIGRAITFVCLPLMIEVQTKLGADYDTLSRPL